MTNDIPQNYKIPPVPKEGQKYSQYLKYKKRSVS